MRPIMIVKMDIVHDMRHRFDQVPESMEVNHLGLQRVIKRFHIRVAPAAALATLTVQQVMSIDHCIQLFVGELGAPVGMEYHRPLNWLMILQCHQKSLFGQARIAFSGEAPTDDFAAV